MSAFLFSAAGDVVVGEDALGEPVPKSLVKQDDPDRDAAWHVAALARRAIVRLLNDATYDMLVRVAGDSARTGVHVVDVRGTLPEVTDRADDSHATDARSAWVPDRFRTVLREVGVGG